MGQLDYRCALLSKCKDIMGHLCFSWSQNRVVQVLIWLNKSNARNLSTFRQRTSQKGVSKNVILRISRVVCAIGRRLASSKSPHDNSESPHIEFESPHIEFQSPHVEFDPNHRQIHSSVLKWHHFTFEIFWKINFNDGGAKVNDLYRAIELGQGDDINV